MSEKFKKQYGGSGEGGEWKTIKGTPVFIADGQTVEEAMEQTFKKKATKPKSESIFKLSDADKQIVEDAIYWLKKDGKAITSENVFKQLDEDMSGFRGNKQMDNAIKNYMNEKYSKTSVQKSKRNASINSASNDANLWNIQELDNDWEKAMDVLNKRKKAHEEYNKKNNKDISYKEFANMNIMQSNNEKAKNALIRSGYSKN